MPILISSIGLELLQSILGLPPNTLAETSRARQKMQKREHQPAILTSYRRVLVVLNQLLTKDQTRLRMNMSKKVPFKVY